VVAPDDITCLGDTITVSTTAGSCGATFLKLEVENYSEVKDLFILEYDRFFVRVNLTDTLALTGGSIIGPDVINGAMPPVNFYVTSINDKTEADTLYYSLSLINPDKSVIVSYRNSVILLPQAYIELRDSATNLTPISLGDLACDTTYFFLNYFATNKCYANSEKLIRVKLDAAQLKYIDLEYYFATDSAFAEAKPWFIGDSVMYSGSSINSSNDSILFRVGNANTFDTLTRTIPFTIDFVLASDSSTVVGRTFYDTIVVKPYKGIQVNDLPSELSCERQEFDITAWNYCTDSDTNVVKMQLLDPTNTDYFSLEFWFNGSADVSPGYYPVQSSDYISGALFGMSDVFTTSVDNIKFRVLNTNHTSVEKEVKIVLSIVDSSTLTTLYTKEDTITIKIAPLPEITIVGPDTLGCVGDTIKVSTVNACDTISYLQLVVHNYDNVKDLFTLERDGVDVKHYLDLTGKMVDSVAIQPGSNVSEIKFYATSLNETDSIVEIIYTVNVLNLDALAVSSASDTIKLLPKPYINLSPVPDILGCAEIEFDLEYFVSDETCYNDVPKRIKIELADPTHLDYINLQYKSGSDWYDAKQYFDAAGVMYSDPNELITNQSGVASFRLNNISPYPVDTIRIPYRIVLVDNATLAIEYSREYVDTLLVLPYKGLELDILDKLVNDTLSCDDVKFDLTAWDYCDAGVTKTVKLQITDGNIDNVRLQYRGEEEYLEANPYFVGGVFYGESHAFSDNGPVSARFRLINNNYTGEVQKISYTVAIVNKANNDTVLFPEKVDTVTFFIEPLPKVDVLFADTTMVLDCGWKEFDVRAILGCREGTLSKVKVQILNPADTSYYKMRYYEGYGYNSWFDFTLNGDGTQVGPFYGFVSDTTLKFSIVNNNYSGFDDELIYQVSIIDAITGVELAQNTGKLTLEALTPTSISVLRLADGQVVGCDTTEFEVTTIGGCIDSLVRTYITINPGEAAYFDLEYLESDPDKGAGWSSLNFANDTARFHPDGPYRLPLTQTGLQLRIINKNTSLVERTVQYGISVIGENPVEEYAKLNGWFVVPVKPEAPANVTVAACLNGAPSTLPTSPDPAYLELRWYDDQGDSIAQPSFSTAVATSTTYQIALRSTSSPYCESPKATVTFTVYDVPTIDVRDTTICAGSNVDLAGLISSVGGADTVTYWTTVVSVSILSDSKIQDIRQSVTYTVQAEKRHPDVPGGMCTASADIRINVNPLPETPIVATLEVCQYATATLPTPPQQLGYEYVWYDANASTTVTPSLNTDTPDTVNYKVSYRNIATGCESEVLGDWTFIVHAKPVLPVLVSTPDITTSICAGDSVIIRDTVNRTGMPYSYYYRWYKDSVELYTAPENNFIVVGESGEYTVVVISDKGCKSDTSQPITVIVRPLPTIAVNGLGNGDILSCDSTDFSVTTTGGCVAGTYVRVVLTLEEPSEANYFKLKYENLGWSELVINNGIATFLPDGPYPLPFDTATLNMRIINENYSTTDRTIRYTLEVKDTSDNLLRNTVTSGWFILPVKPPVPAAPLYDLTVAACAGDLAPTPVSHDTVHLELKWYVPGSPTALAYPPVLRENAPTTLTYEVALRSKTYPYCESERVTFTFKVREVPTIAVRDTTICYGNDVDLSSLISSVTGATDTTYWETVVPVSPLSGSLVTDIRQSVTYTVQAEIRYTDIPAGMCTAAADIRINVNPLPEAPIFTPGTACQYGPAPALPTPLQGYEIVWYNADASTTITLTSLRTDTAAGIYHYKAGYRNLTTGCESSALSDWTFTLYPKPATPVLDTSGVTTFCEGGNVVISDTITRTGTTYRWYKDGATLSTVQTANAYTAYESGVYTLVAIGTGGCESDVSAPITVTVNLMPTVPVVTPSQPVTICEGEQVTLTAVSTITDNTAITYKWYANNVLITGATASIYTTPASLTATTTYTVEAISTQGCTSTRSGDVVVTVNLKPVAPTIGGAASITVCADALPTLSITTTTPAGATIEWYKDAVIIPFATATSYQPTETGVYTVRYVSAEGCSSNASTAITLTVNPLPPQPVIVPGGILQICENGTVVLKTVVSGGSNVASYEWYLNGTPIAGATGQTYLATQGGSYTVRAVSTPGCKSSASEAVEVVIVLRPDAPIIFGAANNETIINIRKDESTSIIIDNYSATYSYQWYHNGNEIVGERGSSLAFNPVKIYNAGIYTVKASSLPGCDATSNQVELIVINTIVVPNVLTPNEDGTNDILVIKGLDEYLSNELTIVNRWGNQVFYMKNYDNSFTGDKLQDGVYFYKLKLTDHNKLTTVKTGYITLKKD
jgi:gliding motility-associated-like protein